MIIEVAQVLVILFFSVVLHECAHGWVANKLGDPTARLAGRLTLNPIKHIDPVGTIIVPLVLRLLSSPFVIGWAKPVPINFFNLRNPKRDMLWVALAGPGTNILLACFFGQILRFSPSPVMVELCTTGIFINLILAVFNLVPIPPLDGSRIVMSLLPDKYALNYCKLEPFGILIVIVLFNFGFMNFIFPIVMLLAMMLGVDLRSLGL